MGQERPQQVSVNIFDLINLICKDFRRECRKEAKPQIEEWLSRVPKSSRPNLFQNLLEIELNFRRSHGGQPTCEEYLKRFPAFNRLVRQAFFEDTMMSMEACQDTPPQDSIGSAHLQEREVSFDSLADQALVYPSAMPDARRIGDYELVRELGRGGMGVVYEARHLQNQNRVALKTLPTGVDGQEVNAERLHKFRHEFRSLSEINHPNLVGMQTLEVDGAQWFFTMDLIDGTNFLEYVRQNGKCDFDRLLSASKQLAFGISALHEMGIIHRDLKPSNVLVTREGSVKVLDFGLVTEILGPTDQTVSVQAAHFAGTPRYAAPEQMTGQFTKSADWYALGSILYEALTGSVPFDVGIAELFRIKQTDEPPVLSGRNEFPGELALLVDGLLKRKPEERLDESSIAKIVGLQQDATNGESTERVDSMDSTDDLQLLIGREEQLARLSAIKERLLSGSKPMVTFISGKSGEGKSTLAEKFLSPLRSGQQVLVLSGRCYDREAVPYKVIDSIIDPLVSILRTADGRRMLPQLPADIHMLATLFPLLRRVEAIADRSLASLSGIEDRQVRYRGFAAFRQLVWSLCRSIPVIIFVDDLQWGDGDSAKVVSSLFEDATPRPLMFLGSFRSDEAKDSPFLQDWGKLNRRLPSVVEKENIDVHPLTQEQCLSYLAIRFGMPLEELGRQAAQMFSDTKGNPYFVEQLVEGFDPVTGDLEPIPLVDLINAKLGRLPENSPRLLEAIAVSGQALNVDEAIEVVGAIPDGLSTLTHMRNERLIRLVRSGDQQLVDTYHDKIRETTLIDMDGQERKAIHTRFVELIEDQERRNGVDIESLLEDLPANIQQLAMPARIFDLAFHSFEGSLPKAFAYQLLAGEQSCRAFAFETALDHLTKAGQLLEASADSDIRFRITERLAWVHARMNNSDESVQHYSRALEQANNDYSRAVARFGIGLEQQRRGYIKDSSTSFRQALNWLREPMPTSNAGFIYGIMTSFARLLLFPGKMQRAGTEEARKLARLASEIYYANFHSAVDLGPFVTELSGLKGAVLALRSGDRRRMAFSFNRLAGLLAWGGKYWLSDLFSRRSLRFSPSRDDIELVALMSLWEGMADSNKGNYENALSVLEKGIEALIRSGNFYEAASAASVASHIFGLARRSADEIDACLTTREISKDCNDIRNVCWGDFCSANAFARSGDLVRAHQYRESSTQVYDVKEYVFTESLGRSINAFVFIQSSDYLNAKEQAELGWRIAVKNQIYLAHLVRNLPHLIESVAGPRWNVNSNDFSLSYAKSLCRYAKRFQSYKFLRSRILRSKGRLLCKIGNTKSARVALNEAVINARSQQEGFELAKCLLDLAAIQNHGAEDNRRQAVEILKETETVIPYAESWLLGEQFDESVVAPEFEVKI